MQVSERATSHSVASFDRPLDVFSSSVDEGFRAYFGSRPRASASAIAVFYAADNALALSPDENEYAFTEVESIEGEVVVSIAEHELLELAVRDESRFIWLMESGKLTPGSTSVAAEIAGIVVPKLALPSLLLLSRHPSSLVREGAALGLAALAAMNDVARSALDRLANESSESSAGVRSTAREILESLE